MHHRPLKKLHFHIRLAQQKDLISLADILATSFYLEPSRRWNLTFAIKLIYPTICWGISLDLAARLAESPSKYVCFVAADRFAVTKKGNRAIATMEMNLHRIPVYGDPYPRPKFKRKQAKYPYISNLAVHPQWRRRGVALDLLRAAEKMAIDWGFDRIFLHVLEDNQPARLLYRSLGYELYMVDSDAACWWLGKPRRLLLKKQIT